MSDSDDEFSPENVQALIAEAHETIRSARNYLGVREPPIDYPPVDVPAAVVDQSSRADNCSEPTGASVNHLDSDEVILISETLNPNPFVIDLCSPDEPNIDLRPRRARVATPQVRPFRMNLRKRKSNEIIEVARDDSPPSKKPATSQPSGIPPCVICFEDMINRRPHSTICGHVFCQKCIMSAIQSTKKCPVCRKEITKNSIHPIFLY